MLITATFSYVDDVSWSQGTFYGAGSDCKELEHHALFTTSADCGQLSLGWAEFLPVVVKLSWRLTEGRAGRGYLVLVNTGRTGRDMQSLF